MTPGEQARRAVRELFTAFARATGSQDREEVAREIAALGDPRDAHRLSTAPAARESRLSSGADRIGGDCLEDPSNPRRNPPASGPERRSRLIASASSGLAASFGAEFPRSASTSARRWQRLRAVGAVHGLIFVLLGARARKLADAGVPVFDGGGVAGAALGGLDPAGHSPPGGLALAAFPARAT